LNDVATLVVPLLAVAAAGAALAGLVQTRGVVALGTARRHGIEGGRKRLGILDGRRAMRAATGGVVLATIVLSAVVVLRAFAPDVAATMSRSERALGFSGTLLEKLGWWIAALLVSGCIVELLFEHATWLSRLRMTPREVKEERREREGDPDVRRARRRAHEALLRSAPPSRDV
jgi:flagellar biosynthesis protein FlhB